MVAALRRAEPQAVDAPSLPRGVGGALLPRVGDYQQREITPTVVEDLCGQLRAAGVGVHTQRKALMWLQGILRRAVVRGLIPVNPVSVVDNPRQPTTRRPQPLEPLTIERMRTSLRQRDATLLSLLAYAGLRPAEATSAREAVRCSPDVRRAQAGI
jgi:integrase